MALARRLLLAGCLVLAPVPTASAATWPVTKTADTNDGTCDDDCSLREAVVAANANPGPDTIHVPAGLYLLTRSGGDDEGALGDLDLTGPTTVTGAGSASTTIDAGGIDRIFDVDPAATGIPAAISGLTIRGGSTTFGGGILNRGDLELSDCIVSDNVARNGGGILNAGVLKVTDTTLSGNRATTSGSSNDGFGGALFHSPGGSAELNATSWSGNEADRDGGSVFNNGGHLTWTGGAATENRAGASGGALANAGTVGIDGVSFAQNAANDGGAVASLSGSQLTIANSAFTANRAEGLDLGGGGGLFVFEATATLHDCEFVDNVAFGEGGGAIETQGTLTMIGGSLQGNRAVRHEEAQLPPDTASGLGGALLVILGSQASLTDVDLSDNRAGRTGGGVYLDRQAFLSVAGGGLEGNHAETGFGGGIYSEGSLTLQDATLADNHAALNGGALSLGYGTSDLLRTQHVANESDAGGGGLYAAPGTLARLVECSFSENAAATFGGAILAEGSISARNSSLRNSTALTGGAVFAQSGSVVALTRTEVAQNVAQVNGGGIWNEGQLTLADSILSANVGDFGGAIGNRAGSLNLRRVALDANTARVQGGGVFNFDGGSARLDGSSVTRNLSLGDFGGGIANESSLVVEQSTIAANEALVAAGGLLNNGAGATAALRSVTLSGNLAPQGSAWWNVAATGTAANTLVTGSCKLDGGSLASFGGNLESPGTSCGLALSSDASGVADAKLGPLVSLAGTTSGLVPQAGSPAIDTGIGCGGFDQGGARRPRDGDANGVVACDVGALEVPEPGTAFPGALTILALSRRRHGMRAVAARAVTGGSPKPLDPLRCRPLQESRLA